jgi:hypothetical protein
MLSILRALWPGVRLSCRAIGSTAPTKHPWHSELQRLLSVLRTLWPGLPCKGSVQHDECSGQWQSSARKPRRVPG